MFLNLLLLEAMAEIRKKKHLKTRKNSSEINSPLDTIQFISCFVNRESALYNII